MLSYCKIKITILQTGNLQFNHVLWNCDSSFVDPRTIVRITFLRAYHKIWAFFKVQIKIPAKVKLLLVCGVPV